MIKDVGSRLVLMAHKQSSRRLPYPVMRHQNIRPYRHRLPIFEDAAFIAPNACVQGNVQLGHGVGIFYHTYIRNYHSQVPTTVGDNTVILDRTTFMGQIKVGHDTLIGCGVTLDMCEVHDNAYVGHGACLCVGAIIESGSIVAAGTVIEKDVRVPTGELWAGNPGKKVALVTEEQASEMKHQLHDYLGAAKRHSQAIREHYHDGEKLDKEWLAKACQQIEARAAELALIHPDAVKVPVEAKMFLQPRVAARLPAIGARISYPVNRMAPWMAKSPDWPGNV